MARPRKNFVRVHIDMHPDALQYINELSNTMVRSRGELISDFIFEDMNKRKKDDLVFGPFQGHFRAISGPLNSVEQDNYINSVPVKNLDLIPALIPDPKEKENITSNSKPQLLTDEQIIDILKNHLSLVQPLGFYSKVKIDEPKTRQSWLTRYRKQILACAKTVSVAVRDYPGRDLISALKDASRATVANPFMIERKYLAVENSFRATKIVANLERYWASTAPRPAAVKTREYFKALETEEKMTAEEAQKLAAALRSRLKGGQ